MRGTSLILLIFLLSAVFHYGRRALPEREELPAVLRLQPQLTTVAVTDNRGSYALYQFNDDIKLSDVIKMTKVDIEETKGLKNIQNTPISSGEMIKLTELKGEYFNVEHSWLSARHRILLHIPLHPDRMTLSDWESLPGIGAKMAAAIEADRQKNGAFHEFVALERVKGVGSKKLEAWKEYFTEKRNQDNNRLFF